MKDKLDREIMVGDTLAYVAYPAHGLCDIKLAKVLATAAFGVQVEGDDGHQWVATRPEAFVICNWAKGAQAA